MLNEFGKYLVEFAKEDIKVTIQSHTIVQPIPSAKVLAEKERKWRLTLPADYKEFIGKYHGGIPNEKSFECNKHDYAVTRFLCILKDIQENSKGWYDISVVESQIGECLTDNEDLIGVEVLPIAELFSGDYLCFDYRENELEPFVCVWSHEESEDFSPVTYRVADTFSAFIAMLK